MCAFLSKFIDENNLWKMIKRTYIVQLVVLLAIFSLDSFSYVAVYSTIITISAIHLVLFLLNSTKINTFGDSQLAGICITTLASFFNLGNNGWIQQKVTAKLGYYPSVIGGFIVAGLTVLCFQRMISWVENGRP